MRSFHALAAGLAFVVAVPVMAADEPTPRRVSLAFINDVHAQIEPHPELFWSAGAEEYVKDVGGLARVATVFNRLRAERPGETVFIDGGDTIQGSGPAAWTKGQSVVEPMNALGLDFAIPGNWFVAYGADAWNKAVAGFKHPMIAANVRDERTGELIHEPYIVKEVNGVRIGFVGFTDPEVPHRQPPHLSKGLALDGEDALPRYIAELREKQRVDLVVLVTHVGLPKSIAMADEIRGVDVILSADTHERTYEPIIRGDVWVVEAGSFASFVGVLDLQVGADGEIVDRSWRLIELRPELFPEDPEVKKVVETALAPHRERMNRVIGRTDDWLARDGVLNSTLDQVIADAVREAAGTEIGLSNGYRFSPPTAPGPITVADLWNWLPIPLELKRGEATGAQLRRYWERELQNTLADDPKNLHGGWLARPSGMTVDFDRDASGEPRLRDLFVAGAPLKDDVTYTLAAGDRKGAPNGNIHRVQDCKNLEMLGATTHDAVEKYLERHSPIHSNFGLDVRRVDRPGLRMRSQILDKLEEASR